MNKKEKKQYTEETIQTLDALEHIRLRSGMYIGRLGDGSHYDDGIYILLKEIIDNGIDEFIMGHGKRIEIDIDGENNRISVRDFGRGIPLGKVVACASHINTGAKYNDDVFQFSVGLNGVGMKAVNALSSSFSVCSRREGRFVEALFEKGKLVQQREGKGREKAGTQVLFTPDPDIFPHYQFQEKIVLKRIHHYAYLNRGLVLSYNGEEITSENGLLDLINEEVTEDRLYEPLYYRGENIEWVFLHTQSYGERYFSFVNGQYTSDGGSHLSAFREGILKGINSFAKKNYQGVDVRDGIVGALSVKVQDPIFESQTKNKLNTPELRAAWLQEIKEAVEKALYQDASLAEKLLSRIALNEKLRKELASVKREVREKQKKISFNIPKLRDCKFHRGDRSGHSEETMIFLTEGDSASASIVAARNPFTQAVFSLRGKPLNVLGMKREVLYKHEEMFHLMSALRIEEELSSLRYHKIIIATDADVDGMHIRNLLLTFFLVYFEGLVLDGHLWLLQTPLFKIRSDSDLVYCYSEEERQEEERKRAGKKRLEITRFKGLGEISPNEFKRFIGKEMRIVRVNLDSLSVVKPVLHFYMGKNTPQRKQFITDHLIHEITL